MPNRPIFCGSRAERWGTLSVLVLWALAISVSCAGPNESSLTPQPHTPLPAPTPASEIVVSAAADLTFAFTEIGALFEQETGTKVVFNFGSTGLLAQQIEQGAPIDLFAAANVSFIEDLARRGRVIPETQALYARGRITLWTRADSPLHPKRVEELTDPRIKLIAIANPDHAPYGVAAREAMQAAGVWDELQSRLVLADNAMAALQYAQRGDVDVTVAPLSLSIQQQGQWVLVPETMHKPIDQALAVVAGARHEAEARAFAEFINGPTGRPIMRKYGFVLPGESPILEQ